MVFLRKLRWNNDLDNDFVYKCFSVVFFLIFETLDKRNVLGRNFSPLAEAEDINAGASPDGREEIIEGRWNRTRPPVLYGLVCLNYKTVEFSIDFFPTRESYLDFYFRPPFDIQPS